MKIGYIGLGIMGSRIAANLQKGGHELVVYNRTKDKASQLIENGAEWADSPAAVAEKVNLLFTMMSTPQAVEAVAFGENGLLDHLKPGSLWVDSSTVNPTFSREMAAEAQKRQIRFVDAPVAGSRVPAEKAALTILVGGELNDVKEVEPLLSLIGQKTIHAGGVGQGSAMKLVINLLLAHTMLAFSEGLVLGQALGLDRSMIFDSLQGSIAIGAAALMKRAKIEAGDYSADFPLQWMQKDLEMISISAYENHAALPATNLAKELYAMAMRYGMAEDDFSAIYRFISGNGNGQ